MNKSWITGIGVVSRYGDTPEKFWNAISSDEEQTICDAKPADFTAMCLEAIQKAACDGQINLKNKMGCIVIGTGVGMLDQYMDVQDTQVYFMEILKRELHKHLGEYMKIIIISTACSAAAQAIAYGTELLHRGKYSYVIAGGAELASQIVRLGFERLKSTEKEFCRPFDKERRGIYPGEGAVFFSMEKTPKEDGYGYLAGYGITSDAYHVTAPSPEGVYARVAVETALKKSDLESSKIDAVVAHGTGTRQNDKVESEIIGKVFGKINVTSPKGKIGHTGGASGAFSILTAALMLKYQAIPPIIHLKTLDPEIHIEAVSKRMKYEKLEHVMVNCFAFGGTNIAIVCSR